jgi:hypothetical protein
MESLSFRQVEDFGQIREEDTTTLTQAYSELIPFPLAHSKLGVGCKAGGIYESWICCRQSTVAGFKVRPTPTAVHLIVLSRRRVLHHGFRPWW